MARVTATEVKQIIDVATSVTDPRIDVFITQANLFVTSVFSGETSVSDDILKEIERNVAAHLIHSLDPRISRENTDDTGATYQGLTGMFLTATYYGQAALMLDPTGKLAQASGRKRASIATMNYSYTE